MRLNRILISLSLLTLACGPTPEWRSGSPVRVEVDPGIPIPVETARQAVADRLAQFGIPAGDSGSRSIQVGYDPVCGPPKVGAVVVAHTSDKIWVCPAIVDTLKKSPRGPYLVISHEVGHVLGLVGHLPAGGNLMAAILDNYKDLSGFSGADLRAICSSGNVDSPTC